MFLTTVNLAKVKSKHILVRMISSAGTGYCYNRIRLRLAEKAVTYTKDPIVNQHVLFYEKKKIRSI